MANLKFAAPGRVSSSLTIRTILYRGGQCDPIGSLV